VTGSRADEMLRHRPSVVSDHQAYLANLMAELDRAAISSRLGEALRLAGVTQQEAADYLGVHKRSIEDYVSPRKQTVPFDRLEEWATLTGVTKAWLLHGEGADDRYPLPIPQLLEEVRRAVEYALGGREHLPGEVMPGDQWWVVIRALQDASENLLPEFQASLEALQTQVDRLQAQLDRRDHRNGQAQ
jgi:transcriptional regulator with XRE-family HTH domain